MKQTKLFDIEIYWNYFLIAFKDVDSGVVASWEMAFGETIDTVSLSRYIRKHRLISFNGINFDIPILMGAIAGFSTEILKRMTNDIIIGGMKPWDIEKEYKIRMPRSKDIDHIDLIEVAPGQASLKIYNGRMHGKRMQDLPYQHDSRLTNHEMDNTYEYCINDLESTGLLLKTLKAQIELREQMSIEYGIDLRSKSDAQVAEAVIKKEVSEILGRDVSKPEFNGNKSYSYNAPKFISFGCDMLNEILEKISETKFRLGNNGAIILPESLSDADISIGKSVYRMGIGGLHSTESSVFYEADAKHVLIDRDVVSYYPKIIIGQNLAPAQMGSAFQQVYSRIVDRRIAAKIAGDKIVADSLKITINGSFGKFGNRYSSLYSPQLLIQTTITGQLALLMLIEEMEINGIPVVSANTDGVVMHCHKSKMQVMSDVVAWWEKKTGYETEATEYKALYSRDVNNYIAIKPDGSVKKKGAFGETGLMKNPANEICSIAVTEFLKDGVPLIKTIRSCRDITKFVTVRTVNGGAIWGDPKVVDVKKNYLGKAIRWYYSSEVDGCIHYGKANKTGNYNKVPKSDGARPLMELPDEFPNDVDYFWYVKECRSMLQDLGFHKVLY